MRPSMALTVSGALIAVAAAAAPPKPSPGASRQVQRPGLAVPAIPTKTPVPSGTLPLPDLNLSEVRVQMLNRLGEMPGGQPCWSFSLQPVFSNIGVVATGPFRVVWERADNESGPYVKPCDACSENIPDAKPGVGMLPTPRTFNNCGGVKWYRVRLDPENVILELREENNSRNVHL